MRKKRQFRTFRQVLDEQLQDPAFKKAYDDLDVEFALISALIRSRIEKGVTQKELAKRMGTKQSSIARFESGNYNPTLAFVKKLADALGAKIKLEV